MNVTTSKLSGRLVIISGNKGKYISLLMGTKLLLIRYAKRLSINTGAILVDIE